MPLPRIRRIAAHYLYTADCFLKHGVITLDSEGTITDIDTVRNPDSISGVEFFSGILIPGLVNAHTHLELSYLKGAISPDCGFTGFADRLRASRNRFTYAQQEAAAAYNDSVMWAEGVSAAGDISNGPLTMDIKSGSRVFYHTFAEAFGFGRDPVDNAVALCRTASVKNLACSPTPHSAYSLNEESFREVSSGEDRSPLSIHFMESPEELELFMGTGAMKAWYDAGGMVPDFTEKYDSPAHRIVENTDGGRRVLLIHNTYVRQDDIDLLGMHFGDNLTWVLCPRSNMFITGSLPPVQLLRDNGCRIAVGTDSLASNTELSIIGELKMFAGIPLAELLRWATLGGAQALGIDGTYGTLEPGKRPGIVLLEGVEWGKMALTPGSSARRII